MLWAEGEIIMNAENVELLIKGFASFHIELTDKEINIFKHYYKMLMEWNEKINLTAIVDEREVVVKHFIDSVSVLPFLPGNAKSLIDVGTGAGFPGIPIKIVKSDIDVTLLDSLEKRVRFLNTVISETGLAGINAVHARAEEFGQDDEYRECYDIGIARAVSALPVLCEYVMPFVRVGGYFIAMKGSNIKEEISEGEKAVTVLGGEIEDIKSFLLPFDNIERNVILIKKLRHTPTKYPRKSGKPSKSPIK